MRTGAAFSLTNTTKRKSYGLPFSSMKEKILGKKYSLSLVLIGDAKSRTLNRTYREKDYPTNVLSFPLSKETGEIYLTVPRIKIEAKQFEMNEIEFAGYLFIHGLLHLKGYGHGVTMNQLESKYTRLFGIPDPHRK
jgi:probable rRNA maturation factor